MGKTFIIAEAGANHNRDLSMAMKLIDVAVDSKVDAIKFQTYSSETLYSKYTPDFAAKQRHPSHRLPKLTFQLGLYYFSL